MLTQTISGVYYNVNVELLGFIVVDRVHGLVSQLDLSSSTHIVRGNVFRKQGVALLVVTSRHRCLALPQGAVTRGSLRSEPLDSLDDEKRQFRPSGVSVRYSG